MKLFLRRTVILLFLLTGTVRYAQAQTIGAGDLVFTGINIFDDDNSGSTQNDAFSFVLLRDCPANTTIYFTDLGWTGSGFQSSSCGAGNGSQTDGVIQWSSGATALRAGRQVVVSCKYFPTATIGTVTGVTSTAATSSASTKEYISLGLAGDQLFAFTGSLAAPTIIGGINVNRKTWETSLGACDFSSSSSVKPVTSAVLDFPSINAINARYNCSTLLGVPATLRSQIQDTTKWNKDYTLSSPAPFSFSLKNTPPCSLTVVVPNASGIVYVNNKSNTPGGGSSWSMPLPELRDALTAAALTNSGIKQIWVAKSTYRPTAGADRSATFSIPADVAVYGGFEGTEATLAARNIPANPVILSGDLDSNDIRTNGIALRSSDIRGSNSYQVVTVPSGSSTQRVLDGVTITGGSATSLYTAGGGMNISGDITITHTKFYGNAASATAGALYNGFGNVQLANCVFFGNSSGDQAGAIENGFGILKLTNVTISGNSAVNRGGGLITTAGNFTAYNTIISGNTSVNNQGADTYFSAGANNFYYSILGDQYYTNTSTQQPTPAVTFTDFANGDLRLTTANYGINKGDPQTNNVGYAAQADTKDLAGQTRISNTVIDLGAYEYQAQPQAITFPLLPDRIYGDENIDPGATTSGDATVTYTSGNTAIAQIVNGKIKTTGAGTTTITANAAATNTYLPASPVTRTLIVAKKPLTIKADDKSRPYGTANPAATFTYTGFVYNEDASVLTGAATAVYGATQSSNVGTYPITTDLSGVSSNNYQLSASNGTLTITQQQQTISFTLPVNAAYGDAPVTLALNTDAGLPIVYTVSGPASISGNTLTITGAGDVTVTANQPGDANRAAAPQVQQTFTVAKAVLTLTANDKTRPYNQVNPALDYAVTGFVNGENNSVLSGAADISTTAAISSPVGNYPITITAGSLSAANYSFSFVDATLSITQESQTITFPAIANQTYGVAPLTLNATSSSGLPITYTVTSGPATISGNILTITSGGNITITATQAGDVNYTAAAPVSNTFRVFKRNIFLRIDNQQRLYGTNNLPLTYTYDAFVNGDDASSIFDIPQLSTTADASSSPGNYPITVTNLGDLNSVKYSVIPVNGILTVNVAPQTINFPAITDKTYGDAVFALNASSSSGLPVSYSLVGGPVILNGNNLTITGTGTVTIAADQAGDGNYSAASRATQIFNVNKAALTVTANNKTKSYLQANPALDYTIAGFVNGENNSVVSGTADISTTADVNSTPGTYPITVAAGSLGAANYTFSYVNGMLTVNQATQTISFPAITDRTYGDAAFTLNASSNSGLAIAYSVVSGPATISGNTVTITGTGTVTIAADQAGDTNYTAAAQATQTFNVNKALLTVTANDKAKRYLQANPALDYIITGFVYNEDNSVLSGTADINTAADVNSTPGTYPITVALGNLSAANYTFSFVNGTLTVTQATQTINFPAIADKTYGDAAFNLNATSNSGLAVTYSVVSGPAIISGNTVTITGTGAVTIAADQAGDSNHLAAAQATQSFNVNRAVLTVTANDKTKIYLQPNPALDYTITGFVYGENNSVVSGTAGINTTADANSTPGTYPITAAAGNLSAANYTFSFVNGTLTVNQATQSISFPAIIDKTYGDAAFALSASSNSGLAVTYSVVSGPATISGNTVTITGTGTVAIAADQAGDANYTAAAQVTQSFNVNKAVLTVTANSKTKRYLQANPALDYTITGFVYNEDNSVVSGLANINTTANTNSTPGTYPITAAVGSLNTANYTFSYVNGTLTVTQATQTTNFPAITAKTYGDAAFTLNATSNSGLAVTYSVISGPATISANTVTITGTGTVTIAADQAGDANYTAAAQVTQTFTVNKAVLTVTANDKTKTYLQANPALDYIITGFVNSESNSVVSGTAGISTTANTNSTPGTYPIAVTAGSLNAANYSFSLVNGTLTISQATQTISFPAITDKTYGDAAFALNASSSSGLPVTYTITSGPATINGNTLTITGAGTVTVTANQAGDASYTAAAAVSNSFLVAPAVLTVQADNKQKIFGVNNPPLTYTITGFVNNDNNSVVSGAPVLSTAANTNSATGTYPINIAAGSLSAANYTFTTVNGTLTIGLTAQTITFPAITDKTYGDAAFTLNATSSSALPVSYSVVSGPATINGNTLTITGAGAVTIAADQAGNANYLAAAQATQSFNVAKATLTVTAVNDTRIYNGTAYTAGNGVSYTGFVNGDNATKLTGSITYTGTSQGAVNAGAYVITPSGLSSGNYDITYANGQLTITRATQQITFIAPANKNQGDPDFTLSATASSGLPVTLSSNNTQVISLNGNTAHVGIAGSAVITASQAGDNNYEPAQSVTQTIQVTAWATPVITAQGSTTFCAGNTLVLQSSVALAYEWYRDGILLPGAFARSLTVTESGSYTVKAIFAANTSVSSAAVNVSVNPLPVGDIQVTGNTTIGKGETVRLSASGGNTYVWSPASGLNDVNTATVVARPAATVTYQVTISNNAGCSVTKEITITVKEDFKLEASNILTPNGDGRNDLWIVKNIDMYPQNEVKIFDRAGRIIYRQQNYANNWNGMLNGQPLAEGTYYYIVDLGDNKPKFKGFITIILDK